MNSKTTSACASRSGVRPRRLRVLLRPERPDDVVAPRLPQRVSISLPILPAPTMPNLTRTIRYQSIVAVASSPGTTRMLRA